MKGQHTFIFVLLIASAFAFVCKDGVPYKENDCNGCFCTKGLLGCTDMACSSDNYKKLFNCEVGTKTKRDCNDCECVEKLGTICTNHKC